MKLHRLCLDTCGAEPKHIIDMKILEQHDDHDQQTIEKIYNRINEPENLKIVKDFMTTHCYLDSLIVENNNQKQSILRNFAINITLIFEEIEEFYYEFNLRSLIKDWKENKRLVGTLNAITPQYDHDLLSQIEGEFSFLKKFNIGGLQKRTEIQQERNNQAKKKIYDLLQVIEKMFVQNQAQEQVYTINKNQITPTRESTKTFNEETEQIQLVSKLQVVPIRESIKMTQSLLMGVNQDIELNCIFSKMCQWDEDGKQEERLDQVKTYFKQFEYDFQGDRKLSIKRSIDIFTTIKDLSQMVYLCLQFQPDSLDIDLSNNGLVDIFPLKELKALVGLDSLVINLNNNGIIDITPLQEFKALIGLTNLKISLCFNRVIDISPLKELKTLVGLTSLAIILDNNKVIDITPLSELKALKELTNLQISLHVNRIIDINPLEEFKALVGLTKLQITLYRNGIKEISSINSLKALLKLTSLNISFHKNGIRDIYPFGELKTLVELNSLTIDLSENNSIDIYPLRQLRALTNLTCLNISLDKNCIKDISPLGELKALTRLTSLTIYLQHNAIIDITALGELKVLVGLKQLHINLEHNELKDKSTFGILKAFFDMQLKVFTSYSQLKDHFD